MSILATRITRVNGEIKDESTIVADYTTVEAIVIPVINLTSSVDGRCQDRDRANLRSGVRGT